LNLKQTLGYPPKPISEPDIKPETPGIATQNVVQSILSRDHEDNGRLYELSMAGQTGQCGWFGDIEPKPKLNNKMNLGLKLNFYFS